MNTRSASTVVLVGALLAGCGESPLDPGTDPGLAPDGLAGRYEWTIDGWVGTQPSGQPTVVLTWYLPQLWLDEVFRVYSRRTGASSYTQIATVTSCGEGLCRFSDVNVVPNRSYDYYVASVDERSGFETPSEHFVTVAVPAYTRPPRATAPHVIPLDGNVYLEWQESTLGDRLWKYLVFLEQRGADSVFYQIGETDGPGFLDVLAQNGTGHRYSIAAVDVDGHIGERSKLSELAIPRPDALGELVFAFEADAARSGFHFDATNDGVGRIVSGTSSQANWRLEADDSDWYLRPLGDAVVLDAGFTTALNCGPARDPDCHSVVLAPASGYQSSRIPLRLEHTYVLRMGSGSGARYAKVRVQILGFDGQGLPLLIFDWAFQAVAGERSLRLGTK
jgi:hypothetical protein